MPTIKHFQSITPEANQIDAAIATVIEATLSAVDGTGACLGLACGHLRNGLQLVEQVGVANNEAAGIVREVVANLEDIETQEKASG